MIALITSLARHLLTMGMGYLVAKGLIPEDIAGELVIAGVGLVVVGWSQAERWYTNRKNAQRVQEAVNETVQSASREFSVERLRADGGLRD